MTTATSGVSTSASAPTDHYTAALAAYTEGVGGFGGLDVIMSRVNSYGVVELSSAETVAVMSDADVAATHERLCAESRRRYAASVHPSNMRPFEGRLGARDTDILRLCEERMGAGGGAVEALPVGGEIDYSLTG